MKKKRVMVTTFSYPPYCPTHNRREKAVKVLASGKFKGFDIVAVKHKGKIKLARVM